MDMTNKEQSGSTPDSMNAGDHDGELLDAMSYSDDDFGAPESAPAAVKAGPRRDIPGLMRKIPVTLTLEVGSTRVSLQDLVGIEPGSVLELDTVAGEPLIIKVNGTYIGRGEVIVSGENYGLRVVEMNDLDLDSLSK